MPLICHSDKIDNNGAKLAQLNPKDSSQFLPLSKCFFGVSAEKELLNLKEEDRKKLRSELVFHLKNQ